LGPTLVEACRYHRWANLHLLSVCESLNDRQLRWTAPGTYGTIAATFQHLVAAERRYLWRLQGGIGRFTVRHQFPGIPALREEAARTGAELIEMAPRIKGGDVVATKFKTATFEVHKGVLIIQALHHGNDHRTHVCSILGHHGVQYGDMDVWAYGEAIGAMVRLPTKA